MYKKTVLIASILLIGGCGTRPMLIEATSQEEKALLSSFDDRLLLLSDEIRITENGFYPNYLPLYTKKFIKSKYSIKSATYLNTQKFYMKEFIEDAKQLKPLRLKLLKLEAKYPKESFELAFMEGRKEIDILLSTESSLHEKQKKILSRIEGHLMDKRSCKKDYLMSSKFCMDDYIPTSYSTSSDSIDSSSHRSYPSSGGYSSGGGSHWETVYVPGGNGRTTQRKVYD